MGKASSKLEITDAVQSSVGLILFIANSVNNYQSEAPTEGHQLPSPSDTCGCFTFGCVVNELTSLKLSIRHSNFSRVL